MPDSPNVSDAPGLLDRDAVETLVGRSVNAVAPYAEALTHRSLVRGSASRASASTSPGRSNERLEFLGDALLGAEVAEALFHRFPDKEEGYLSRLRARLVSGKMLAQCARRLDLGACLRVSSNADRSGTRESRAVLADAFEALIGALYLDLGAGAARSFIKKHVLAPADLETLAGHHENHKSRLQEYVQARRPLQPTYRVVEASGPPHARVFTVEVFIGATAYGTGTASNKKKAEQEAAYEALGRLREEGDGAL